MKDILLIDKDEKRNAASKAVIRSESKKKYKINVYKKVYDVVCMYVWMYGWNGC